MMGDGATVAIRLSDHLDSCRWTIAQKIVLLLGSLAFVADGLANQILGIAMPAIIGEWGVTKEALAPVAAAGLFGVAVGSIIGGLIGDRTGRRWGLILSIALFGAMTIAAGFARDPWTMGLLRFADGLGIGAAIPNGCALVAETAPRNRRILAISLGMVFIPVGGTVAGLLGALILEEFGWRTLFFLSGFVCMGIVGLFVLFLPESPSFLVQHPLRELALRDVIARLTGPVCPTSRFYEVAAPKQATRWSALLTADVRKTSLGIWLGFFSCLLGTYTLFNWLPTLLHDNHFDLKQSSMMMSAVHGGGMGGGLVAGFIMHHLGARKPTIWLAAAATLAAGLLSVCRLSPHQEGLITAILFVLGLLLAAIHSGFYALAAEAYAPALRATGIGTTSFFGRLGAIASSFTGALALLAGSASIYFIGVAAALMISVAAVGLSRPARLLAT